MPTTIVGNVNFKISPLHQIESLVAEMKLRAAMAYSELDQEVLQLRELSRRHSKLTKQYNKVSRIEMEIAQEMRDLEIEVEVLRQACEEEDEQIHDLQHSLKQTQRHIKHLQQVTQEEAAKKMKCSPKYDWEDSDILSEATATINSEAVVFSTIVRSVC
eukprot:CAMPEP_0118715190 /NCGR_PEP_ID=MMETSP0800-20121206/26715_1 /TAXON_ID=210618 ORGANISM="Striatella unipunctata, Strain CCMP2910" /NCGR_SAMPLE_ID=MMETSP0800 /ASSEMBLY_ACC=CAM_ASM_000638 /LENGTH=158 /DNA_ID=CAMNT_0006621287 /DNA_START=30 /DNA_END=506 /DNA_ORIENTATION=+